MTRSSEHAQIAEALGAWVLDACPQPEADQVEAHVAACPECAAEADQLRAVTGALASLEATRPPAGLRERVRASAFRRRAPSPRLGADPWETSSDAAASYTDAVGLLDALLEGLTPAQWQATVLRDRSVQQLLHHLVASDHSLASQLLPAPPVPESIGTEQEVADPLATRESWRAQAGALLDHVGAAGRTGLRRPVRLLAPEGPPQPVSYALAQRTFETWIHADDIRTALGRPPRPLPTRHLRLVAGLGVRLLPLALRRLGREHPGRTGRLVLEGEGAHTWTLPLAMGSRAGEPDVTIRMDLSDFCYLMGNRRRPETVACTIQGERSLAFDLLTATSTLGCGD
jgi:uncharacterized protein (TIGR03083 family)